MTPRERTAASTDEEIEAYTVGAPRMLNTTVHLDEYDPTWPARFERQARLVREALGDAVLTLDHVGSTSIPGIAAKPIIDMCLVVADTTDEDAYVPPLEAAGFVLNIREPHWHEHRAFRKRLEDGDDESVNLHVYQQGCVERERYFLFRDWLIAHPEDRELYERTKRELAARVWKHIQNYADAKTAVIEDIRSRCGNPAGPCARCPDSD
ncbi:MAG TPA: GrpB family protein [Pseudonocardiaceae bacterium]